MASILSYFKDKYNDLTATQNGGARTTQPMAPPRAQPVSNGPMASQPVQAIPPKDIFASSNAGVPSKGGVRFQTREPEQVGFGASAGVSGTQAVSALAAQTRTGNSAFYPGGVGSNDRGSLGRGVQDSVSIAAGQRFQLPFNPDQEKERLQSVGLNGIPSPFPSRASFPESFPKALVPAPLAQEAVKELINRTSKTQNSKEEQINKFINFKKETEFLKRYIQMNEIKKSKLAQELNDMKRSGLHNSQLDYEELAQEEQLQEEADHILSQEAQELHMMRQRLLAHNPQAFQQIYGQEAEDAYYSQQQPEPGHLADASGFHYSTQQGHVLHAGAPFDGKMQPSYYNDQNYGFQDYPDSQSINLAHQQPKLGYLNEVPANPYHGDGNSVYGQGFSTGRPIESRNGFQDSYVPTNRSQVVPTRPSMMNETSRVYGGDDFDPTAPYYESGNPSYSAPQGPYQSIGFNQNPMQISRDLGIQSPATQSAYVQSKPVSRPMSQYPTQGQTSQPQRPPSQPPQASFGQKKGLPMNPLLTKL